MNREFEYKYAIMRSLFIQTVGKFVWCLPILECCAQHSTGTINIFSEFCIK